MIINIPTLLITLATKSHEPSSTIVSRGTSLEENTTCEVP